MPPMTWPLVQDLVLIGGGHAHALVMRKWGMQPIIVKYLNSLGQSDFTTGFKPNHEIDEFEDLFLYQFGDTNDPLLGKAISLITGQTRLTRSTVSTSLRSSQIDEKKTLDMKNRSTFEMYDDVRGDDIRNLMKKK